MRSGDAHARARGPAAVLAAVAAVVAAIAAGVWFWSGVVAPGYRSSIVLGIGWFVAVSLIAGRVGKTKPQLRVPLRATTLTCSALAVFAFYWTSIRETTVNERVVEGRPASELSKEQVEREVGTDPLAPQP